MHSKFSYVVKINNKKLNFLMQKRSAPRIYFEFNDCYIYISDLWNQLHDQTPEPL